ncbi:unnamed protein product [Aspergillus niger]|uniref:Contig An18c0020, genomic contig n=1 Tax=Aspergillus niger (strain ATCC MYA-4892 / CBS 513.88 / FGSC A1513) TaxID=425011 RepID=A2R9V1_ASPNC|nr:unnamed protein product [Aspergillus niger]
MATEIYQFGRNMQSLYDSYQQ